ncbi:MAG: hybrid sensor histidine kinase/response regulator [Anaerolineae bacterium]|jgi:signal transduction histidine kinase|nr:hybrid sensor histidine kinase/response regulator [Anaerolineae bacterium]
MTAHILVIEDDVDILSEVVDWLTFDGYRASGAPDGQAGIRLALQHVPDLIISDINMPQVSGYRVLFELRSNPATALIPFIFLTARSSRGDVRYGMEVGAADYITKPFTSVELLGAVKAQLSKRELIQQHTDQQMEELRTSLIYTLPHELRTPLSLILGNAELLAMDADDLPPAQVREMAEMIVRSGQRLHRLIENYLLYAQIELMLASPSNVEAARSTELDVRDRPVMEVCELVADRYQRSGDMLYQLAGPCRLAISRADFERILTELVDNACKFSAPGTPVRVITQQMPDLYQIRIEDAGRGMKPEDVKRIGAYMQFDRALYEQQGSGLGLVIARRLVELYGGTLHIDSTPQRGTISRVSLPLATA